MDKVNAWLVSTFPSLEPDFKLQDAAADFISEQLNLSSISSVVGSFASILGDIVIGLFSIFFISFFFIKDDALFRKIIGAIVPDRIEEKSKETIGKIENLLSRYFTGLVIEVAGVVLLNFLGMVVAIPAYTVLRAIAATFFGDCKAIRRLIHES